MKVHIKLFFILFVACATCLKAQQPNSVPKTSIPNPTNSYVPDSIARKKLVQNDSFPKIDSSKLSFSKDALDTEVEYGSKDSLIFDNANSLVYLYGAAYVNYKTLKLTADYIVIDMKNNIATAEPQLDSVGKPKGIPNFKDGTQDISMKKMGYNFRTKKGIAYDVTTKYNDAYVHGGLSKFVSSGGDSTKRNDVAYSTNAIFTTCDLEHPHFGIYSSKQKVIPNKLAVVGPSQVVIADIPTPLWLPFAFFPLTSGKHTGLIFPRDYEYSPQWGYGFRGIGYYFPLGEHYDLQVQGDVYVRGTWGLRTTTRYATKYKSSGQLEVGYNSNIREDARANKLSDATYNIRWSHNQDQRANPNFTFNASVNFSGTTSANSVANPLGSGYNQIVNNDFRNATTSTFGSNIGFTRTFAGKPYTLTGGLNHSQNVATRDVNIEFPNLDFRMQTIFPFKKLKRVGEEKWFEKVSLQYSSSFKSRIQTKDSLLFTQKVFDNLQTGLKHEASSNINFTVFKYFNLSPSVNFSSAWYMKETKKTFNPRNIRVRIDTVFNATKTDFTLRKDTVFNGKVDTSSINGLNFVNQFSAGVSLSTRVFGTLQFKKGALRGIRHTMTPSIGFSYSPAYTRYQDSVQTDNRNPFKQIYSRYENAIFSTPSNGGQQMALTYGLTNLFEIKTFNSKDSTFKKIKLLENVSVNGSYNAVADSFRWSEIAMGTGTNFFKGLTTLSINALFDPYGVDGNGRRVQESALKRNGKLLNLVNVTLNLNTSISIGQIRDLLLGENKDENKDGNSTRTVKKTPKIGNESLVDLLQAFRFNHNFSVSQNRNSFGRDTTLFSNSVYTSGDIPISKKWRITVGNIGYDFVNKQLTYPDFGFYRDLHCWEMGMNWQPTRGTYAFYLRVKPGTLDFLKLPYNKNIGDASFRR